MGYIYKITNLINNKIYIGQTIRTIEKRWQEHLWNSFNEKSLSYNCLFHKAIRKYGKDNFKIEKLEECENKDILMKEKYWINYYNSCNTGYNSFVGGELGKPKISKIEEEKVLELWKSGLNRLEIAKQLNCCPEAVSVSLHSNGVDKKDIKDRGYEQTRKPISQYTLNGEYIRTFKGLREAERHFNKNYDCGIRSAATETSNQKTAFGFQWRFTDSTENIEKVTFINGKAKEICQYDLEMNLLNTFSSISEAKRFLKKGDISSCLRGKTKTAGGYIWKYKNEE